MKLTISIILLTLLSCNSTPIQTKINIPQRENITILKSNPWRHTNDDYRFPSSFYSKPVISGIHLLTPTARNGIIVLDIQSGNIMCTISNKSNVSTNLAHNSEYLCFGDIDGFLYCYSNFTFKLIWRIQLSGNGAKALCLHNNRLYASLINGELACIDTISGDIINKAQIVPFSDIKTLISGSLMAVGENTVCHIDAHNLTVLNKHVFKNTDNSYKQHQYVVGIISTQGNNVYLLVMARNGNAKDTIYMCDNSLSKFEIVHESVGIFNYSCNESRFVFSEKETTLFCYDMINNKVLWRSNIEKRELATCMSSNYVFTFIYPGIIAALDINTGELINKTKTVRRGLHLIAGEKGVVALGEKYEIMGYIFGE